MSEGRAGCYVTMRARKPFLYRGRSVEAGDTITLPINEAERLRMEPYRYLEHMLSVNINAKLWSTQRRNMELRFD